MRMIFGRLAKFFVSTIPILLTLTTLSGCTLDGYPEDLAYPARTDPIVIEHAKSDASALDKPGEFPNSIFVGLPADERDKLVREPAKMNADQAQQLNKYLVTVFGSPAHPTAEGGNADARDAMEKLSAAVKLDKETLAKGSKLYRQQCLHCHGVSGDGRGPTSPWVNPHPRDYRQGVFKFTSSKQAESKRKPRKDDLVRTLREGIEGTSMPSFRTFTDDDLDALASYVIHLSIRGETEFNVMRGALSQEGLEGGVENEANSYLGLIAGNWLEAQSSMIQPESVPQYKPGSEEYKASVRRGYKLFIQQSGAGCIGCHTDYGRQSPYKYDYWGTIVKPIDLTQGNYRGGHRPLDIYWRIHSGINGTGMTAFGQAVSAQDLWDLVNFVQVLPYQKMREECGVKLEAN
jgi:mono/diheme cytochrome c family protein